jgi:carboxymethylenebutenolidase
VIVIHANRLFEPYIASTTAMLAEAGFVALAVDVFHFLPGNASWQEAQQTPGELVGETLTREFTEPRLLSDVQAGIDYVRGHSFVQPGGVGLVGFCGGGWNALLIAAQSLDVGGVVAFYAPVALSDPRRRSAMDVAPYVRVPVQYHRANTDPYITAAEVATFAEVLRGHGTSFERFDYDASHGFFAHNRPVFDREDAENAWRRTVQFLRRTTGKPIQPRQLAPANMSVGLSPAGHGSHAALH